MSFNNNGINIKKRRKIFCRQKGLVSKNKIEIFQGFVYCWEHLIIFSLLILKYFLLAQIYTGFVINIDKMINPNNFYVNEIPQHLSQFVIKIKKILLNASKTSLDSTKTNKVFN